MCEIDWTTIASLSKGMLTPLVALIAVYIAYQQWQTNKQKLVLDRYDRRLKVYEEVTQIIRLILCESTASMDALVRFRNAVTEVDFLFGPEIPIYMDEIYHRGTQLEYWTKELKEPGQPRHSEYNHEEIQSKIQKEHSWLISQFTPAKQKFRKYLDVSK